MDQPVPQRIPEDRVAAILARAADLDRTARETVDLDAVRLAALEAGISPSAVDRALDEYVSGTAAREVEPVAAASPGAGRIRGWLRKLRRPVQRAAVVLMAGLVLSALGEGAAPLVVLAWLVWVVYLGRLARKARPARSAFDFCLTTVLTAVAGAFGYAAIGGLEELIALVLVSGAVLAPLGALYIKLPLRRRVPGVRPAEV